MAIRLDSFRQLLSLVSRTLVKSGLDSFRQLLSLASRTLVKSGLDSFRQLLSLASRTLVKSGLDSFRQLLSLASRTLVKSGLDSFRQLLSLASRTLVKSGLDSFRQLLSLASRTLVKSGLDSFRQLLSLASRTLVKSGLDSFRQLLSLASRTLVKSGLDSFRQLLSLASRTLVKSGLDSFRQLLSLASRTLVKSGLDSFRQLLSLASRTLVKSRLDSSRQLLSLASRTLVKSGLDSFRQLLSLASRTLVKSGLDSFRQLLSLASRTLVKSGLDSFRQLLSLASRTLVKSGLDSFRQLLSLASRTLVKSGLDSFRQLLSLASRTLVKSGLDSFRQLLSLASRTLVKSGLDSFRQLLSLASRTLVKSGLDSFRQLLSLASRTLVKSGLDSFRQLLSLASRTLVNSLIFIQLFVRQPIIRQVIFSWQIFSPLLQHNCSRFIFRLKGSTEVINPCSFPCLNGGQCVHPESCDCSLYQATGTRCQTVPNPGFEREMACRSWGQYNYESFDGLYYHFPGRCTYTLLRDCEDTSQASILIQVHNDPDCRSSPYSCTRSVSLFLPWEGEIRLHRSKVTFKGQSVQLPHHIHDVELEKISRYVLVTQQHGFTLAWDGHSGSVYIKLSPEWVGRTCGLCGNFNADVQDDLKTSYGVVTEDLSMFGNSWVEEELHQVRCPMVPFMFPSPCASRDPHILLVSITLTHTYYWSGPNGDVVCQVFTEYARVCAHADHPLTDWRTHIPQCAMPCPPGLQYKECITCCPVSCNVDRMCIDNKLQCLDGCYCPDDLIYEEGSCVKASDCPCEYHGMVYPSGQTVQEECNNCTCVGGVWNCTEYSCPGECSVTGDMFFHSFDGRMFTFPASCQYVLAKSRNSGKFTVTIQNTPCGPHLDGSCIQSVSLVIDEDPRTEITLTHLGEVFMAGQYRISLPYSDEVFHIQELSSMYLQVRTALGLHLQYSWREFRLYLQVDELWKGDTVGLCGTFNGNIQDDFLSPSGMIESTPHLFGNAWRVSSACVPSQSVPQLDPCDTHQQAASYASEMCDILNQELFSACHEYLSPVPFHQQCKADTCKCGQPCLCSSLAHYARQCRKYSVITEFRASVPDCEVTCPDTMEYGTCVSSCQRRCSALSTQQHCGEEYQQCPLGQMYLDCTEGLEGLKAIDGISLGRGLGCEHTCESHLLNLTCSAHEPCIPGCFCPPGLLKHGDECFEPDACPCLWKGKEYYPGDRVTSPCHQCVCQHGTFQCVFRPCPSMCTAYGDRHYRTFDGLLFDYVGVCKVYLVKSSADLMMSVTAENVDCYDSGVICRKSLLINIGRSFIAFDDDSGKPNPSSVIDWRQEVFIWSAGLFTVVHVPEEDLTVLWDRKTTVHIQAGPRWQGKLSGLCGNFDLRTVNEMRTPENIDSATPQEFGNSWTAAECVNSPDIRHPCSLNPLREPFSKRQCGVLLSEVFLVCHPVVDVTWFYMNCLADTCGCSRGGDCECFCTSVAAYAHRCCHQGVTVDWRSPSICPYDCEYYNKVLGKGPYRLVTYRERDTVLAANRSSGTVFPKKGEPAAAGFLSLFMMTPGLSRARPHDTSLVSFEASDRPNYFLAVDSSGHLTLTKWEESEAFWAAATFTLHHDTWIQGYDSLEALARPGFFLHYMLSWIHLMKYKHTDGFRKATLFKLTGPGPDTPTGPKCQWRYESCVSPCFRTCSDPSGEACGTVPKVEGCLPLCPGHMVLDEVTQRCVHVEDCIKPPVAVQPLLLSAVLSPTPAAVTPSATTTTTRSSRLALSSPRHAPPPGPPVPFTTTSIQPPYTTTPSDTVPTTAATTTTIPIVPTTVTDKVVLPSTSSAVPTPEGTSAAATPSTPSLAISVRPEMVERQYREDDQAPSSTPSPLGPSTERTSQVPFSITALFWLTSSTTRPSLHPGPIDTTFTSPPPSTTMGPWISSTVGPTQTSALPAVPITPTSVTTKATTRPGDTGTPASTTSRLTSNHSLRDTQGHSLDYN
ncbi:otogelin-like [Oncorhynchus kisutch]|uniref:otogelin-like n=1 Tax=Oncorhynchus kisutch TaxID=8019 RepID=UPI0012DCE246|nr:otogelin-like [Oncorhynchus kisutch]